MVPHLRILRPALPPAFLALSLAFFLGACGRGEEAQSALTENKPAQADPAAAAPAGDGTAAAQQTAPSANGAAHPRSRTSVQVLRIEPRDFTVSATYIGYLQPRDRVEMRAELEGVVERVLFDDGQRVKSGTLLANISTEQVRVRRDQAKADLELAETVYTRERDLNAKKLLPDSQLDQTRTRRDQTRLTLRLAEIELKKSQVTAPLDGTVKKREINLGEFLTKGQLVTEILDISRMRAVVNVPEREMRFIQVGRPVQVRFDALPGETLEGTVKLVGLEADLKTRTFPVEVELDNSKGRLRSGMLARVTAALRHFESQVLVPRYAVLERELGRFVYVADGGAAVERRIETGASSEGDVQVLDGLKSGELLIVAGQHALTPGELVEVRDGAR